MTKIVITLFNLFTLLYTAAYSQNDYNLLYLNREFNQILTKSQKLTTDEDYFWNSLVNHNSDNVFKAIQVLEEGIKKLQSGPRIIISKIY